MRVAYIEDRFVRREGQAVRLGEPFAYKQPEGTVRVNPVDAVEWQFGVLALGAEARVASVVVAVSRVSEKDRTGGVDDKVIRAVQRFPVPR